MSIKEKYEDYRKRGIIRPLYDVEYDEDTGFYCNYYYPTDLSEKQMEEEIKKAEKHLEIAEEKIKKMKSESSLDEKWSF